MTYIIIGSTAMREHGFSVPVKDLDVFSDRNLDVPNVDRFWHPDFDNLFTGARFATVDELYTIKASHAYWELENGSWAKHMTHMLMLKRAGAVLDTALHDALYSVWQDKHGRKRVNLNMESGNPKEEVWKPYPRSSRYSVSNLGRVRGPRGIVTGTPATSRTPYWQYSIDKKSILGHTLVMETFVGPRPGDMEVRHLDGDGHNNTLSNLAYGTKTENAMDRERHGTNIRHEKHPLSKLTMADAENIRARYARGGCTQRSLAAEHGVAQSLIGRILSGQSWKQERDFFDDAVPRVYVHDSLHESVAYGDEPMYAKVLESGKSVKIDMAAVRALAFEDQVRLFREEIYATALERWVIPSRYRISPRKAYDRALRRTITSLTKGWSATFIVDNFETFMRPDMDYVAHHKSKSDKLIRLDTQ